MFDLYQRTQEAKLAELSGKCLEYKQKLQQSQALQAAAQSVKPQHHREPKCFDYVHTPKSKQQEWSAMIGCGS